ncbi:MAG TPA: hypothetical protein DEQ30_06615 [Porphyromonadaceae bacterium]|nr:hypothetical protein [Porphyromonadaceae bacterium]
MSQQIRNYIFIFSGALVLAGAVLYITHWMYAPYVFAVGAAGITVCFMTAPYQDLGFRLRRLHRINVLAGISMIVSSVFMFRERMEWVVFLLIAALLLIYTSFVSPRADE